MDKEKVLIVYHRVDFDGLSSFCTAKDFYESQGYTVEGFGFNYNDQVELPHWEEYCHIVLCDISLPVDVMKFLWSHYSDRTIWIDHHITSIEDSVKYKYDGLQGVRDTSKAACVLTYEYFHKVAEVAGVLTSEYFYNASDSETPYSIRLLGAYDIWDKSTFDWEKETRPMQTGLQAVVGIDPEKLWRIWPELMKDPTRIIKKGADIIEYTDAQYKSWIERFAFEVEVDGHLRGIAMICPVFSSIVFQSVFQDYDVCVVVERSNKIEGTFNVSMYMEDKDTDFSCGQYMKDNYGGGGHKGAAGGRLNLDQFNKLISECKI